MTSLAWCRRCRGAGQPVIRGKKLLFWRGWLRFTLRLCSNGQLARYAAATLLKDGSAFFGVHTCWSCHPAWLDQCEGRRAPPLPAEGGPPPGSAHLVGSLGSSRWRSLETMSGKEEERKTRACLWIPSWHLKKEKWSNAEETGRERRVRFWRFD